MNHARSLYLRKANSKGKKLKSALYYRKDPRPDNQPRVFPYPPACEIRCLDTLASGVLS